jgi:hypothetical protein
MPKKQRRPTDKERLDWILNRVIIHADGQMNFDPFPQFNGVLEISARYLNLDAVILRKRKSEKGD